MPSSAARAARQVDARQEAVTGWIKELWRPDELEEASSWIQPPGCGIGRGRSRRRIDLPHSIKLGIKLPIGPVAPPAVRVTRHLLVLNEDECVAIEMTVDQVDAQDPFKSRGVDITDTQRSITVGEQCPVDPVPGQRLPTGEAARVVAAQHLFTRHVCQPRQVTAPSSRIPGISVLYIEAGERQREVNRVALQRENFAFVAPNGLGLLKSAQAVDGRGEVRTQGEDAVDHVVVALPLDLDCRVRGHTQQHCQLGVGELPQLQGRINQLGFSDGDPIICRGWSPGTAESGHADDRRCA